MRIYCLTIPGSDRHRFMKEHLENCGCPYQFVFGNFFKDEEVPWEKVTHAKAMRHLLKQGAKHFNGVYGCATGHIRLLNQAILNEEKYFISVEDDVKINKGVQEWAEQYVHYLDSYPAVHLCPLWWQATPFKKNLGDVFEVNIFPSDAATLYSLEGAKLFKDILEKHGGPSDYVCGVYGPPTVAVTLLSDFITRMNFNSLITYA